jgi:hypothetical protein
MKVQLYKTRKEFRLFDLKNALCFGLWGVPMVVFVVFDLSSFLYFALSSLFFGLFVMTHIRFFSTDELLVSEHELTFSHSKREKISFDHIDRMEVFMKERTFRSPIDLIIHFERDYVVIRFDKFNFKNPKKEFFRFQQLLPEGVKSKMVQRESAYFEVELNRLGKQGMY